MTGVEFLAMFVPHIQLRFECKIRLYGALSTTLRKRWGWIEATSGRESTRPTDPEHVADLIEEDWDSDFLKKRRGGYWNTRKGEAAVALKAGGVSETDLEPGLDYKSDRIQP